MRTFQLVAIAPLVNTASTADRSMGHGGTSAIEEAINTNQQADNIKALAALATSQQRRARAVERSLFFNP